MKFVEPRELKTNERWSPKNLIFLWPKALGWCWWSTRPLYEVMGVSPFASNYWNLLLGRGNFHQLQHDSVEASCTDTMYNVYIYIYISIIFWLVSRFWGVFLAKKIQLWVPRCFWLPQVKMEPSCFTAAKAFAFICNSVTPSCSSLSTEVKEIPAQCGRHFDHTWYNTLPRPHAETSRNLQFKHTSIITCHTPIHLLWETSWNFAKKNNEKKKTRPTWSLLQKNPHTSPTIF